MEIKRFTPPCLLLPPWQRSGTLARALALSPLGLGQDGAADTVPTALGCTSSAPSSSQAAPRQQPLVPLSHPTTERRLGAAGSHGAHPEYEAPRNPAVFAVFTPP